MNKKKESRKFYRFNVLNDSTFETIFTVRGTKARFVVLLVAGVVCLFVLFYLLVFGTPVRKLMPGYLDPKLKQQVVSDAIRLDSLTEALEKQDNYLMVVKALFSGEYDVDSTFNMDSIAFKQGALKDASEREKEFRAKYEESEKYNLTAFNSQIQTDGILFYTPAKGKIVTPYSAQEHHFGIDVSVSGGQAVLSVLDGQVLFAGYTPDYEYIVIVQHHNDFVSVYRQLNELLKKEGEKVNAGEALAFVSRGQNSIPHLHFELWYKGHPLNPEEYISF